MEGSKRGTGSDGGNAEGMWPEGGCRSTSQYGEQNNERNSKTRAKTRMVQLPTTAAIEYVAACCRTRTRTRTRTKSKIGTITKTVRGSYARSPQIQCVYAPSRLSVPSIVA